MNDSTSKLHPTLANRLSATRLKILISNILDFAPGSETFVSSCLENNLDYPMKNLCDRLGMLMSELQSRKELNEYFFTKICLKDGDVKNLSYFDLLDLVFSERVLNWLMTQGVFSSVRKNYHQYQCFALGYTFSCDRVLSETRLHHKTDMMEFDQIKACPDVAIGPQTPGALKEHIKEFAMHYSGNLFGDEMRQHQLDRAINAEFVNDREPPKVSVGQLVEDDPIMVTGLPGCIINTLPREERQFVSKVNLNIFGNADNYKTIPDIDKPVPGE